MVTCIEKKCNQDVKFTNSRFVVKTSMENIHSNTFTKMSWEANSLSHYSAAGQVLIVQSFSLRKTAAILQVIKRGQVRVAL